MVEDVHARRRPGGRVLTSLPAARRDELRERCRRLIPAGPFDVSATAWAVTARPWRVSPNSAAARDLVVTAM